MKHNLSLHNEVSNYFHFHQTANMYRDLPAKWPETEQSENPSRQWLDRYDTSTYEMSVIMLGSLFSAELSSICKWYPVPTAGGLMTANGGSTEPVYRLSFPATALRLHFLKNISCSEDYVRHERKFPSVCPLLHSGTGPLTFLIPFFFTLSTAMEISKNWHDAITPSSFPSSVRTTLHRLMVFSWSNNLPWILEQVFWLIFEKDWECNSTLVRRMFCGKNTCLLLT